VRERDYFFIASFALWGVWVGMGLATLMEWISEGLEDSACPTAPAVGCSRRRCSHSALIPLWGNHLTASRKGETLARDFAYDLLQSVEPYGVLVTAGDNDTFPLWYAQEVEHVRQDVTVVNLSLANTDLVCAPAAAPGRLRPSIPPRRPAIYRGRAWLKPTGKLLIFSDAYVQDSLQPVYWLGEHKTYANLGRCHGHARSPAARPPVSRARGRGRAPGDQGPDGKRADFTTRARWARTPTSSASPGTSRGTAFARNCTSSRSPSGTASS